MKAIPDHPHRPRPEWHYHFLGIGGVGMSALAEILHGRGIRVSGSDTNGGAAMEALAGRGIAVSVGHTAEALRDADVVVYSSAVGKGHPIWRAVEGLGLPRLHRAELLGALAAEKRTLAVTGTHGKTTTTAALGHLLARCGADPTVLVGGHVPQLEGRNWRAGEGPWLVCEADESDASFLHLAPEAVLLTNVEADHLDFHGSLENMEAAFSAFLDRIPDNGVLVYCLDDPGSQRLGGRRLGAPLKGRPDVRGVSYGFAAEADFGVEVKEMRHDGGRVVFRDEGGERSLEVSLMGRHNALNLCGAYAMGRMLGLPEAALLGAIADFQGVARRQQFVGILKMGGGGGLSIYDDYAHHPTEIRATLDSFLAVYGPQVTVVVQPHLYSRTARFAGEFAEALRPASRIYLTEVYGAREEPLPGVSSELIAGHLRDHPHASLLADWREVAGRIRGGEVPPGVLLTLGAGDITRLGPWLMGELG
ncbi:MAG: UDP-N-acetylmuramate--L-alanine ligase [bacterium]